jgi:hypothetical protein
MKDAVLTSEATPFKIPGFGFSSRYHILDPLLMPNLATPVRQTLITVSAIE